MIRLRGSVILTIMRLAEAKELALPCPVVGVRTHLLEVRGRRRSLSLRRRGPRPELAVLPDRGELAVQRGAVIAVDRGLNRSPAIQG
jgi:hypothetical protein